MVRTVFRKLTIKFNLGLFMTKCCKHYKLKREVNIVGKIEGTWGRG